MPGQLRRALIGDGNGKVRAASALIFVRLDGATGPIQVATYDGAVDLTDAALPAEGTPVWVQAGTEQPPTGWRLLIETLP